MKFAITKNTHLDDVKTYVNLELKKEDLGKLIADGILLMDVPDLDGVVKMTVQISIIELAPRGVRA